MMYGVLSYLCVKDHVLMVKKSKKKGDPNSNFYTLPGGKLEKNEKGTNLQGRLEAAIRETTQETGLTLINPIQFRGIILFDNEGRIFNNWQNAPDYLVYIFAAKQYSGKLISKGDEREKPLWILKQEILQLPKNSGDVKIYEWLKDGRNFFDVIRHHGRELDESNTWIDYF